MSAEPFSGSWQIVLILTGVGLIVGIIHHFMTAREVGVGEALAEGQVEPRVLPGSLLVSFVSLIGGFSISPEVPSGMLGGGLATWISEKRKLSEDVRRSNIISSITAAYGGLFTSTMGALMIPLEFPHKQSVLYSGTLIIAGAAAFIGFAIFYVADSDQFVGLLRL